MRGGAREVRFDLPSGPEGQPTLAAPSEADLHVPADLRAPLRALAERWSVGHVGSTERVLAIAQRLRTDYAYSLDFEQTAGTEPILDFLFARRAGHCEYFASAMTLMARSIGVPARMVGGYRVIEENPLTGDFVVRERNAHAWTEVWNGRRWITVDATATGDLPMPRQTPWIAALLDAVGVWLEASAGWVASRAIWEFGVIVAALIGLWWWLRRRRRQRTRRAAGVSGGYSAPPDAWQALVAALATVGIRRRPSESLEGFAERLDPALREAVLRYAAWRYGGVGETERIGADLVALARSLTDRSEPGG